jgi:hypothetical protein
MIRIHIVAEPYLNYYAYNKRKKEKFTSDASAALHAWRCTSCTILSEKGHTFHLSYPASSLPRQIFLNIAKIYIYICFS